MTDWLVDLSIELTDLEDNLVAELRGDTLFIDINAAGNGWFIDPVLIAQLTQTMSANDSAVANSTDSLPAILSLENALIDSVTSHDLDGKDNASLPVETNAETYPVASTNSQNSTDQSADQIDTEQIRNLSLPASSTDGQSSAGHNDTQTSQQNNKLLQ